MGYGVSKWNISHPHIFSIFKNKNRPGGDNFFFTRFVAQKVGLFCFLWRRGPTRAMASSFLRFLDHTQRRITVGRTPLDEWSARRRDLSTWQHITLTIDRHPCFFLLRIQWKRKIHNIRKTNSYFFLSALQCGTHKYEFILNKSWTEHCLCIFIPCSSTSTVDTLQ